LFLERINNQGFLISILVRQRAAEWGVDPNKVGILGFSAGGCVASLTALEFTPETRPDFAGVIYGALFREYVTPANAPPLFLTVAQNDELDFGHTLHMYNTWKAMKLPVEMHIYASGNHGFGMRKQGLPCDTWIERFEDWLKGIGII
jgi:acetyl esterase/lipase